MKRLQQIQSELKAPKGQYNKYGGYKYRSCEDILEAVKPLLEKHGLTLTITDNIELIGERYYVRATVDLYDGEKCVHNICAYARETESRKGMDSSQITGATSSYARKYALNGMFLIDDTKDADTMKPANKAKESDSEQETKQDKEAADKFTKKSEKKTSPEPPDQNMTKTEAYTKMIKDMGLDKNKCKEYLDKKYGADRDDKIKGIERDLTKIIKHFSDNSEHFKKED